MVVKRGVNEDSVGPMGRHFRGAATSRASSRYMDVGHSNGWRMDEVGRAPGRMFGGPAVVGAVAGNLEGLSTRGRGWAGD